ncbi:hypothetical protein [Aeromonas caviae]|uniref:hypothetical protein n=1 Tax=Aeromonas caviae TaxID=648 RepID=UPI00388E33E9
MSMFMQTPRYLQRQTGQHQRFAHGDHLPVAKQAGGVDERLTQVMAIDIKEILAALLCEAGCHKFIDLLDGNLHPVTG